MRFFNADHRASLRPLQGGNDRNVSKSKPKFPKLQPSKPRLPRHEPDRPASPMPKHRPTADQPNAASYANVSANASAGAAKRSSSGGVGATRAKSGSNDSNRAARPSNGNPANESSFANVQTAGAIGSAYQHANVLEHGSAFAIVRRKLLRHERVGRHDEQKLPIISDFPQAAKPRLLQTAKTVQGVRVFLTFGRPAANRFPRMKFSPIFARDADFRSIDGASIHSS